MPSGEREGNRERGLFSFAFCPYLKNPRDNNLRDLSKMAAEEQWHFDGESSDNRVILFNYLHHTFNRVQSEGKIAESEDQSKCCFNTGLYTKHFEEIYAVFVKNKIPDKQPWVLSGFRSESNMDFAELPQRANYFSDIADIIFDYRLEIRIDVKHILDEEEGRRARLPRELQNIQNLRGAVEMTVRRIKANYRLAVPQFYFGTGRIQLLIPLFSSDPSDSQVKAVIPIEKHISNRFYQGHTCLDMNQAYNNARLIAKLDSEWLRPKRLSSDLEREAAPAMED